MPIVESTSQRLVVKSGATSLILSKETGKASLQRKLLYLWTLKPSEVALSDIVEVNVDTAVDRASGVDVCSTMLVMRSGVAWAFPCSNKKEASETAHAIREFLSLRQL
jgi:hypothetical protein